MKLVIRFVTKYCFNVQDQFNPRVNHTFQKPEQFCKSNPDFNTDKIVLRYG